MKFLPRLRNRRHSSDEPRLYPLASDGPEESRLSEYFAECDRSYDDALSDLQFTRFLHSEYDAQAPAGSFERLMLTIHEQEQQKASAPRPAVVPAPVTSSWASTVRAALASHGRPLAGRLATGAVAVMLVAAALGPNLQALVREASLASLPTTSVKTEQPSVDKLGPRQLEYLQSAQIQVYDRTALLQRDPPDTLMPPHRDLEYIPTHDANGAGLTDLIPRKE